MNKKKPTIDECEEWKKNKMINPITKYKIRTKNGEVYKYFEKNCVDVLTPPKTNEETPTIIKIKPLKEKEITKDICYIWLKNKLKNPFTNHLINEKSKIYKGLEKACIELNIIDKKTKKEIIDFKDDIKIEIKKDKETKNPKHKLSRQPTKKECEEWKKNKLKNPMTKTKGKIIENGFIYNELKKACVAIETPPIINKEIIKKKSITPIIEEEEISDNKPLIIKTHKNEKEKEEILNTNYYPDLDDNDFNKKLMSLKEIRIHNIDKYDDIKSIDDFNKKADELCDFKNGFQKSSFQYLMSHYLSARTPYRSLLLYYSVGVGKTCTAITIAESLLISHNNFDEPMVWVILPSAIEAGFKRQIFDTLKIADFSLIGQQCTGDTYAKLAQLSIDLDYKTSEKRIKKLIKSRYQFFTYEGYANMIENNYKNKNKIVKDKVIIVDEAHNIRNGNNDDDINKRVYSALIYTCKMGINNRLVLLTATPMYNEPTDIYDLFYLLLLNDKREDLFIDEKIFNSSNELNENAKKFIIKMSSNYISYLRGNNPFNFAFKLSPKLSGIDILEKEMPYLENGNKIDEIDKNWLLKINDGIIIAELGEKQKKYLKGKKEIEMENQNNFSALQPMNIVYDNKIGNEGFNSFFIKVGEKEQMELKYSSVYKDALSPDKIGLYSGKFLKLANIIKNSQGIIIIYSKFIRSGVIPIAIMLEHMGFNREGTSNLLVKPNITHSTTYKNVPYPKYAILSSNDPEIMGNTTIDNLMNIINNPGNINGSMVKVVLMTPVAGEGLNFANIREIHILDAWYHFNRIDQIIGRGIRNCSHKRLPIEERNVSVFMYASIDGFEKETPDIHAYRISSRKLYQSSVVDELIRNSAIDCSLFKNINYFGREMFKMDEIEINTSQGKRIKYKLGDDNKLEPKCLIGNIDDIKENISGFREETYKHLGLSLVNKLKYYILDIIHKNRRFITYDEIRKRFINVDNKILMYAINNSIYPNIIIDNISLIPHQDGIHIIDIITDNPLKITLDKEDEDDKDNEIIINEEFYKEVEKNKDDNYNRAIIAIYSSLDEKTFKLLIEKIFQDKNLNKIDNFIENCFKREGVFIMDNEIGIVSNNKYAGFVNIFNEEFEPLIYNGINNYKNLNIKQIELLKSKRKLIVVPDNFKNEKLPFGLFVPVYESKDKKNKINVFKLLTPGIIYGKKTGIVCTSLQKKDHSQIFNDLGIIEGKHTKISYCITIANELMKIGRLLLLPEYKII